MVVMLGAGVAERSGLFAAAMRSAMRHAPTQFLTPVVGLVALLSNLAADAAYVVLIPLAAVVYAAAGRHPIAGITASFAGVSGGFSANLLPGQLDALLFGITEAAAELVDPTWDANIAGNWYFMATMTFFYLPLIWYVTDRIIEPRLGRFTPETPAAQFATTNDEGLQANERRGLRNAGLTALAVIGLWVGMTLAPNAPLMDAQATGQARYSPLFQSLVGAFFLLFFACGWAYGRASGTIRTHRDAINMMRDAMGDLAYYLVLSFVAAHFVAMFAWSNLGIILAVKGANAIQAAGLSPSGLFVTLILFTAIVNIFVGSASAKWALLSPVLVPMLMLLGVSPEMTTAAYRVGDGASNIVSPIMVYFPLVLTFCHRWQAEYGLGSLLANMIPYSIGFLLIGAAMTIGWVALDLPLGPAANVYLPPTPADP